MSLVKYLAEIGRFLLVIFIAVVAGGCAIDRSYSSAVPGLVDVEHHKYFDQVLMAPSRDLSGISKIYIEDVSVSMNSYWLQTFRNNYTERDLERIQTTYGELLKEALIKGVQEQQEFTLADSPAEADIIFRASLDSLNIYAPDLSFNGISDFYVREAGNATFNVLLVDSASGTVRAQFIDHSETFNNPGSLRERANRVTNARYFKRLMNRWAHNLMTYLSEKDAISAAR
jgi:hypothetical protein